MNKLFTQQDLDLAKTNTLLPLKCQQCNQIFYRTRQRIVDAIQSDGRRGSCLHCSHKCAGQTLRDRGSSTIPCQYCGQLIIRKNSQISRPRKTMFNFCNHSCQISYQNANKSTGTQVSKLELWLQSQLSILYPNLKILYNNRTVINSELDIYIPSLNLAFELNGIFHYEPIYGIEQLAKVQNNDNRKFQACLEHKIELCIIDSSKQKYFKESTSLIYLEIITKIIDSKLAI